MLSEKEYITLSLESNLFFLRIVKEHAVFAAASLPPGDLTVSNQLMMLKTNFETLFGRAITLSQGVVRPEVLSSGELVTELTLAAETKTQALTGLPINTNLTKCELALASSSAYNEREDMPAKITALNQEAIKSTKAAIAFKTTLLRNVLSCKAFSYTYPLMLDHVIRESQFYVTLLTRLEKRDVIDSVKEIIELEILWNRIMDEHSKFIRGYLDPSEELLFETAYKLSKELDQLEDKTNKLPDNPGQLPEITKESLQLITSLRNFKKQGTEGILACRVKSIMAPLLGDHVTREANHYLRLLRTYSNMT